MEFLYFFTHPRIEKEASYQKEKKKKSEGREQVIAWKLIFTLK